MGSLLIITVLTLLQIVLYIWAERKHKPYIKSVVLLVLLFCYIIPLPNYFVQQIDTSPDRYQCGLVVLPIYFAFWILGCGAAILLHLIFWFVNYLKRRKAQPGK